MHAQSLRIANLDCRIVDGNRADGLTREPEMLVVLCHGFGASGTDLVPLAGELVDLSPQLASTRFVFPAAPIALAGFGFGDSRAWWNLDAERIFELYLQGRTAELRNSQPNGLPKARRMLRATLDALTAHAALPMSRVVIGGFSQGAMVTTDVALRLDEAPAGLVALSGALINEVEWRSLASRRGGLAVFQSHGQQDPLIPFAVGEWLAGFYDDAGFSRDFLPFGGGHTIGDAVLRRLAAWLEARLQVIRHTRP